MRCAADTNKIKGIRKTPNGDWQAYVRVQGKFVSKVFPKQTALLIMRRWRAEQPILARLGLHGEPAQEFSEHVFDYLGSVETMPSFRDRQLHMREWATLFKGRDPNKIQPIEIRTALERRRRKLSAGSCNRRRTALMHFYAVLNGKSGYNPVRDVPKYPEEPGAPRAQSFWTIYRILAPMRPSKSRARLRVMLWTGFPHAQLMRLQPSDLNLSAGVCFVAPRRKGKGTKGRWLPLLPGAIRAFQDFEYWRCYGKFSQSSMHAVWSRAVKRFNAHRAQFDHPAVTIRPYDLRHSFGTMLAERITDERAIQELLLHASPALIRRYTEAATTARVEQAVQALARLDHRGGGREQLVLRRAPELSTADDEQ